VTYRLQAESAGEWDGLVSAGVIDEHDLIDDLAVKLGQGPRERRLRVIGGKDYGNPA
jgi:hypothetical protein